MEAEGDAIRALGHLFKITEVFLWDDARITNPKASSSRGGSVGESAVSSGLDDLDNLLSRNSTQENEDADVAVTEGLELAQKMGALGLPVSFSSSKERRASTGGKKKGKPSLKNSPSIVLNPCSMREPMATPPGPLSSDYTDTASLNHIIERELREQSCDIAIENHAKDGADFDVLTESEINKEQFSSKVDDAPSATGLGDRNEMENRNSISTIVVAYPESVASEDCDLVSMEDACTVPTCHSQLDCELENNTSVKPDYGLNHLRSFKNEPDQIEAAETYCLDSVVSIQNSMLLCHSAKCDNCKCPADLSKWMVVWDMYYMRNYYYNIDTQESTWNSPLCLECSSLPSNTDGAHVGVIEGGTITDSTCKVCKDTNPSRPQQMDSFLEAEDDGKLPFQSNNEVPSSLSHDISNSDSDDKLFSLSDSLYQLEEHPRDFIQSKTGIPSDDNCTVALQPLSCGDNNERLGFLFFLYIHTAKVFYLVLNIAQTLRTKLQEFSSEETSKTSTSPTDLVQRDDDPDNIPCPASTKKRRKKNNPQQKIRCAERSEHMLPEEMEELPLDILKYWCQRYLLFSKFDMGVKMDEEGWFSVTPELIARHHAERCSGGTVIDCFAGVGGNAIQFALKSHHVIAIDIDPCKIDYAQHNATIYGVQDNIDFIQGDLFQLASKLKGDMVFLSPPWGGPGYLKAEIFDVHMLKPHDGYFLFKMACHLAPTIVMFLPRNVNLNQLAELALLVHPPWELEVEKNYLNGKLKAITAYFHDTS